jgi:hypothetical protein
LYDKKAYDDYDRDYDGNAGSCNDNICNGSNNISCSDDGLMILAMVMM